ncbi:MAG: hypothetical protein P1S60_17255, partial [Anaerolineae bacterium]|nr:hypothetical protein [Anaerolineae bacterium]
PRRPLWALVAKQSFTKITLTQHQCVEIWQKHHLLYDIIIYWMVREADNAYGRLKWNTGI